VEMESYLLTQQNYLASLYQKSVQHLLII
jgi:hypothetical protein